MARVRSKARRGQGRAGAVRVLRRGGSGLPPLEGIRVLDLTRVLAGPFCSMMLGDMGAEIIKVEEPGKGDDTRSWPPFSGGESSYFMSVNRNKKSLTLNLKAPEGQRILRRLIRRSDVILENFRPGTMARLGLAYEILKRSNPGLVYCAISGFGESGPEASRAGEGRTVRQRGEAGGGAGAADPASQRDFCHPFGRRMAAAVRQSPSAGSGAWLRSVKAPI